MLRMADNDSERSERSECWESLECSEWLRISRMLRMAENDWERSECSGRSEHMLHILYFYLFFMHSLIWKNAQNAQNEHILNSTTIYILYIYLLCLEFRVCSPCSASKWSQGKSAWNKPKRRNLNAHYPNNLFFADVTIQEDDKVGGSKKVKIMMT